MIVTQKIAYNIGVAGGAIISLKMSCHGSQTRLVEVGGIWNDYARTLVGPAGISRWDILSIEKSGRGNNTSYTGWGLVVGEKYREY